MTAALLPIGTHVEHRRTGQRGKVARHDYGENIIAADKTFRGRDGLLADGFWAPTADLIVLALCTCCNRTVTQLDGLYGCCDGCAECQSQSFRFDPRAPQDVPCCHGLGDDCCIASTIRTAAQFPVPSGFRIPTPDELIRMRQLGIRAFLVPEPESIWRDGVPFARMGIDYACPMLRSENMPGGSAASRAVDKFEAKSANVGAADPDGLPIPGADTDQTRHGFAPPDSFTLARARVPQDPG